MSKTYAVLGLGRYGTAVAKELTDSGAEVLAVDTNQNIVNQAALVLPYCKCANITDPEVLADIQKADIFLTKAAEACMRILRGTQSLI